MGEGEGGEGAFPSALWRLDLQSHGKAPWGRSCSKYVRLEEQHKTSEMGGHGHT